MAGKQRRERRLKEESQNGRYYYCINCNHIARTGSERINQTFKGEGPCCGGGSGSNKKAKTKFLDGPVIGRKTLKISGMHCEHCANTVTNALNGLDGITAKVNLKDNSAEVSYDREIDLTDLKNAVKKAGYEVTSIL